MEKLTPPSPFELTPERSVQNSRWRNVVIAVTTLAVTLLIANYRAAQSSTSTQLSSPRRFVTCLTETPTIANSTASAAADWHGRNSSPALLLGAADNSKFRDSNSSSNPGIRVFVGVLSRPENAAARQLVRSTWGSDPKIARLMFFTQRPANDSLFKKLRQEATELGDVVISSEVHADYYNITYSVLELFKTATRGDSSLTHVVKTDEDVFVRMSLLLNALESMPRQWLYAGFPMSPGSVLRKPGWHQVSYSNWASDKPVTYAFGWGYVLSVDLAKEIAAGAAHVLMPGHNLLVIEDVAVGYWVEYVGQEKNVSINYSGAIKSGEACNPELVFYHIKGMSQQDTITCMHKRAGECC